MLAVVRNRRLIRRKEMIVEEKIVPEPQPEGFLFLLARVFVLVHIVEAARVDRRRTADVELIGGTPEILADAVQEIIELNVQLLHLDPLVLLDILDRQPFDLLPHDTLRQAEPPRDVEHLEIGIQLADVDVIVARILEIGQKGAHARKIILCVSLERTSVNMRIRIAEEEREVVDADEEPRKRIIAPLNNCEKVLNAVPVCTEVFIAPPTPRCRTKIALDKRARHKDIRTPMRQIETLD